MVGRPSTLAFLALLLAVSSCSRQSQLATQPDEASSLADRSADAARAQPDREPGDFYPLATGNRWTYVAVSSGETRTLDGTLVSSGTVIEDIHRSIECETSAAGASWFVQLDRYRTSGETTDRLDWIRMRQDRNGLYELEVVPSDPYPCGPLVSGATRARASRAAMRDPLMQGVHDPRFRAGLERALSKLARRDPLARSAGSTDLGATTLVRLQYPLRVGASWAIRPETGATGEPTFLATVEAHEVLALPAGRFPGDRIRITSSLFGPDDSVLIWFGRAGMLAMQVHAVYAITDETGTVLGRGVFDQSVRLMGIGEPDQVLLGIRD